MVAADPENKYPHGFDRAGPLPAGNGAVVMDATFRWGGFRAAKDGGITIPRLYEHRLANSVDVLTLASRKVWMIKVRG
jgi:hypothetical protein